MEASYTEAEIIDIGEIEPDELQVSIETKIRTALFFVAWVNQVFAFFGAPTLELNYADVYAVISSLVAFGVSIWAWWKNNSFTIHALIGDVAKDAAREARHAK